MKLVKAVYSIVFLVLSLSNFVKGDRNDDKFRKDLNATQQQTGQNDQNGSSSQDPSPLQVVRNIVIIFVAAVGIILGLALLSYVMAYTADKYCWRPATPNSNGNIDQSRTQAWIDASHVARRAGLWHLDRSERMLILQHFFAPHIRTFVASSAGESQISTEKSGATSTDSNVQPPPLKVELQQEVDVESGVVEESTMKNEDPQQGVQQGDVMSDDPSRKPVDDVDHERTCCICLVEYQEHDACKVLRGAHCNHIFHAECCMEWLKKHDHCPYCRQEMITPVEFRDAAVQVLGAERVAYAEALTKQRVLEDGSIELPSRQRPPEQPSTTDNAVSP